MTIDTNKAREIAQRMGLREAMESSIGIAFDAEASALLLALADEHDKMLALLLRYRNETPLGHQPHMIAYEADAVIDAAMGANHG